MLTSTPEIISSVSISKSFILSTLYLVEASYIYLSAVHNAFVAASAILGRAGGSSHNVFFQDIIAISSEKDPVRYTDAQTLEADTRRFFSATWTQLGS